MLRSLSNASNPRVLSAGASVVVGRNPETGITSLKCSRQQLTVELKEGRHTAEVTQKGFHDSFVNGKRIGRGNSVQLNVGDKLEVLKGRFPYELAPPATGQQRNRNDSGEWKEIENVHVYNAPTVKHSSSIAGFDLDGTLISTKSGRVFPKDESDWMLKYAEVGKKLRSIEHEGYKIVIFTNQKGIMTGKQAVEPFRRKIAAILSKLPAKNIQVFVSPGGTNYHRKPLPGMWEELENRFNGGTAVDRKKCFYVGDAAGREAKGHRKKDFSCNDRLFAENLGIQFFTPEEYFLAHSAEPFKLPEFMPESLFKPGRHLLEPSTANLGSVETEIILIVGFPGSGKSHFVESQLLPSGYAVVNRDTLKTWQKCVETCKKAVSSGKSVVVDNTNPDKESRKRYLDVANEKGVKCRCFLMNVTHAHALHNVKFRSLVGTDKEHKDVNEMVLNSYKAKYENPDLTEGFSEIVTVNFIPDFDDKHLERIYRMHLLEK